MARHVMIDLETFALGAEAVFTQIGAVDFCPFTGRIDHQLKLNISLEDSLRAGRMIDPNTILWWMDQSDSARKSITQGQKNAVGLGEGLQTLSDFCRHASGRKVMGSREQGACVWSHGAAFDIVILESAYAGQGMKAPWHYRDVRDTRTLFELAFQVGEDDPMRLVPAQEVAHDALEDARWQAQVVHKAYRMLGLGKDEA